MVLRPGTFGVYVALGLSLFEDLRWHVVRLRRLGFRVWG